MNLLLNRVLDLNFEILLSLERISDHQIDELNMPRQSINSKLVLSLERIHSFNNGLWIFMTFSYDINHVQLMLIDTIFQGF